MAQLSRRSSLILSLVLTTLLVACGGGTPSTAISTTSASVTTAVPAMTAATAVSATTASADAMTAVPALTAAPTTAVSATTASADAMTAVPAATASAGATTASGDGAALSVFAAASLTDVFKEIGKNFEGANAGSTVTFNFAGSQQLAQQIGQGAPADVFAAASKATMDTVVKSGQVISGTQRTFARNRLVVIFPKANPAGLKQIQDLAKPGLKLDLEAKAVPAGQYSLDVLAKASKDPAFGSDFSDRVVKNVVSYEDNVRAVLTKVALGEADAGMVYTTDINGDAAGKVGKLDIPDKLNTIASYPIATIKDAKHADLAQKFMSYVLSTDGQMVLAKYGFIPTTGSASGGAPVKGPLAISGLIAKPVTLTVDQLRQKTQQTITATDKGGSAQSYQGVPIATLLNDAGVQAAAKKVVFTGGDGYMQELALSDIQKDKDAIISIESDGSLRNIIPSQAPHFWVKGLVKLEVQ